MSTTIVIETAITEVITMPGMEPGQIIAKARNDRGWSQKDLGNRIGTSQVAVQKIERGETKQSKFLPKIAQVLELDLALIAPDLQSQTLPQPDQPPSSHPPGYRRGAGGGCADRRLAWGLFFWVDNFSY